MNNLNAGWNTLIGSIKSERVKYSEERHKINKMKITFVKDVHTTRRKQKEEYKQISKQALESLLLENIRLLEKQLNMPKNERNLTFIDECENWLIKIRKLLLEDEV